LQKILARAGIGSRRRCEEYIRQGRVRVDGRLVTRLGTRVDPESSEILFDDKPVRPLHRFLYLLLHKPPGYVSTLSDPQGRPIVTDLLPDIETRVFPVGRLDVDSEGALLMTNDGPLTNLILHPRYGVRKTYRIKVTGVPRPEILDRLRQGIPLEGRRTLPATIRLLSRQGGTSSLEVILHEGRKRQVRKMFAAVGHPVLRLRRTAYGRLGLGDLRPGQYRFLGKKEIKKIFSGKIPFTIKNIPD